MNTGIHTIRCKRLKQNGTVHKNLFFLGRSTEANIANQSYNLIFNARIETPTKVWKVGTSTYIQTVMNYSFN